MVLTSSGDADSNAERYLLCAQWMGSKSSLSEGSFFIERITPQKTPGLEVGIIVHNLAFIHVRGTPDDTREKPFGECRNEVLLLRCCAKRLWMEWPWT